MRADDWRKLGQSLQSNAELLQELAQSDDYWIPMPANPNKDLAWLISKGLIDTEDDNLYISSLLLDLGAKISLQGFERATPDLEEALIAIQQQSRGYLDSKRAGAEQDADKNRRQLGHTVRQVILHLRDDYIATRSFIEGNLGYAVSPSERLRDIQNAIERIKRLHQKLTLFSYDALRQITEGDRELSRLLTSLRANSLHAAIDQRRSDFTVLLGRLDTLSLSVRKRNRFRLLSQALESFMLAGNTLDVQAMLADPGNTSLFPAPAMRPLGMIPLPEQAGDALDSIESMLANLPEPKHSPLDTTAEEAVSVETQAVPLKPQATRTMDVPFARPHLSALIARMIKTGRPQSATAYWVREGDKDVEVRHWLYALSGYYMRLATERGGIHRMEYRLALKHRPFLPHQGNKEVFDLIVTPGTQRRRIA